MSGVCEKGGVSYVDFWSECILLDFPNRGRDAGPST